MKIHVFFSKLIKESYKRTFKTGESIEFTLYPDVDFIISDVLKTFYGEILPIVLNDHPM